MGPSAALPACFQQELQHSVSGGGGGGCSRSSGGSGGERGRRRPNDAIRPCDAALRLPSVVVEGLGRGGQGGGGRGCAATKLKGVRCRGGGGGGGEAGRWRCRRRRASAAVGRKAEDGWAELVVAHAAHRPDPRDAANDVEEARQWTAREAFEAIAQASVDVLQVAAIGRRVWIQPTAVGEEPGPGDAVENMPSVSKQNAARDDEI